MARWTNDQWISTMHRVAAPRVDGLLVPRRSAAFHDGNVDRPTGGQRCRQRRGGLRFASQYRIAVSEGQGDPREQAFLPLRIRRPQWIVFGRRFLTRRGLPGRRVADLDRGNDRGLHHPADPAAVPNRAAAAGQRRGTNLAGPVRADLQLSRSPAGNRRRGHDSCASSAGAHAITIRGAQTVNRLLGVPGRRRATASRNGCPRPPAPRPHRLPRRPGRSGPRPSGRSSVRRRRRSAGCP